MVVTRKVDYGVRAVVALADATAHGAGPVTSEELAASESIPPMYLAEILRKLRNGGILRSRSGPDGGWTLRRPAGTITVGDLVRVLQGPIGLVGGMAPDDLRSAGVGDVHVALWSAARSSLVGVLDGVTIADLQRGTLPAGRPSVSARPDVHAT